VIVLPPVPDMDGVVVKLPTAVISLSTIPFKLELFDTSEPVPNIVATITSPLPETAQLSNCKLPSAVISL